MTRSSRTLAKALAMALLADARTGRGVRSPAALSARARHCLGLPDSSAPDAAFLPGELAEQLRRLSQLPDREWQRLQVDDLATWLQHGHWRRMAGLPASSTAQPPRIDEWIESDNDEDDDEAWPVAYEIPPAKQSDAQLADGFRAWAAHPTTLVRRWLLRPALPGPQPAWLDEHTVGSRAAPRWATAADLANALGLDVDELLWLAPTHTHWRERTGHALPPSHYRYRLLPKRSGGLRLLEVARPQLARAQRQLLDLALAPIPVHEAAHGFVRGRSVASHVAAHAGQAVVARFDLRDFFSHVHATRVRALWRALGHSDSVADLLTRLTTHRTPAAVRERLLDAAPADELADPAHQIAQRRARGQALARAHLPQGAPTSPAIANLCAFGLDMRLAALARRFNAHYSRYADDLVISGGEALQREWPRLRAWVTAIVQDEGFTLRHDKTRLMPAHQSQQVTGLVLNERPNLPRTEFDRLKAQLHRLTQQRQVPTAERARLMGQLQWASQWLAPTRVAKLQRLWDAIRFED